jgi:hypothetical protein
VASASGYTATRRPDGAADETQRVPLGAGAALTAARWWREGGADTVYRTLQQMAGDGLVDKVRTDTGELAYRWCTRGLHHHLVCRQCGTAVEVQATSSSSGPPRSRKSTDSATSLPSSKCSAPVHDARAGRSGSRSGSARRGRPESRKPMLRPSGRDDERHSCAVVLEAAPDHLDHGLHHAPARDGSLQGLDLSRAMTWNEEVRR